MNNRNNDTEVKPDVIAGRNPVSEAIRSGRPIDKILVARGEKSGAVVGILAKAKDKGILVKEVDRTKLDYVSGNENHQGIVAFAAVREYSTVDDILAYAAEKDEPPFIVILDEIRRPAQPRRYHPYRRMCRSSRCNYSEKTQCGTFLHSRQGVCRCNRIYACGKSNKHCRPD